MRKLFSQFKNSLVPSTLPFLSSSSLHTSLASLEYSTLLLISLLRELRSHDNTKLLYLCHCLAKRESEEGCRELLSMKSSLLRTERVTRMVRRQLAYPVPSNGTATRDPPKCQRDGHKEGDKDE